MTISAAQKRKIIQTINVFETGSLEGNYAKISLYKDGPGGIRQITYGRSQTTEFGNLKNLLTSYVQANGLEAQNFQPFLSKMGKKPSLCSNKNLLTVLKRAGKDPIMQQVQDDMFEILYYLPAYKWFEGFKFTEALSLLVIYDSFIHSGSIPSFLREKFPEQTPMKGGSEREWIKQYVNVRQKWLSENKNRSLRNTIYRTKCFNSIIKNDNWDLSKSYNAHGVIIS